MSKPNLIHPNDGKTVRLLEATPQGNADAVVTLSPHVANQLIAAGKAELVTE